MYIYVYVSTCTDPDLTGGDRDVDSSQRLLKSYIACTQLALVCAHELGDPLCEVQH